MNDERRPNQPTVHFKRAGFASHVKEGVRWWPLILIALGVSGYVFWKWTSSELHRQAFYMHAAAAGLVGVALVLIWCLFFSRLKWGLRIVAVAGVVVGAGLLLSFLEFRGVDGDLVPIVEWKWNAALRKMEPLPTTGNPALAQRTNRFALGDFPQFLGPDRNVILSGPKLARDWKTNPPRQLWRRPVGAGWAGFAVSGTNAVTLEQDGENEVVSCYHLLTGEPLWRHAYAARYDSPIGGLGPRTVPTISSNQVFTLGATGVLNCLRLSDGKPVWSKNILDINGATVPDWGVANSPLILGDRVIVSAGGPDGKSLIAYDRQTGDRLWSGGSDKMGYSSPVAVNLAGRDQILIFNGPGISSHDPETGAVLWTYPWGNGQPHVAVPVVVSSSTVFFSSGYGVGSELLEIKTDGDTGLRAEQLWKSLRMKAKFTNVAKRDGFIYGLDDGILACLDLTDGGQRWKDGRYGHGQMLLVDDLLLVTGEKGEVFLVEPNPDEHRELGQFTAFDHKQWNPPALAGQLLLVRTAREAVCYELPLAKEVTATETAPSEVP